MDQKRRKMRVVQKWRKVRVDQKRRKDRAKNEDGFNI